MAALRPHAFRVRANGMKRHFLHKHSENNLLAGWLWEIMIGCFFFFFSTTTTTEQSWWEVNKGFKWHLATWSTLSGTLLLSGGRQQTNVCVLHCSEDKRRHTRRVSPTGSLSAAFMNKSSWFVTVAVTQALQRCTRFVFHLRIPTDHRLVFTRNPSEKAAATLRSDEGLFSLL